MADQEKKTSELVIRTGAAVTDRLIFLSNVAASNVKTSTITVQNFFANTPNLQINVEQLKVVSSLGTPANSTSTNVAAGVIWTDGTYLYFSSANNVVKRVTGNLF